MPRKNPSNPFHDLPNRRTLARAVSAVIATGVGGVSGVAAAQTSSSGSSASNSGGGLEEIIVTARKRTENLQDIPQSILAFTTSDIQRYGFKGVEDYVRFVPSLTAVSSSPGQTNFVFRGIATSATPYLSAATVGVYLDEQPITIFSQTPEVRLIDIERVETLEGPQGSLYGAESEAGTVRYITNKPDLSKVSGNLSVEGNYTQYGEGGYDVEGVLNYPIIPDTLGVRLVAFNAHDAGYIDNVLGLDYNKSPSGAPVRGPLDNANVVKGNVNGIDWYGARAEILWNINDKWSALTTYSYQKSNANGWNQFDPTLPGDSPKVVRFYPEWRNDQWHQLALTIKGDLGFAQFISATSYFDRFISYQTDLTSYQSYLNYAAYNPVAYPAYDTYNFGPDARGHVSYRQRDWRVTEEARLHHTGSRWDWTLGFFYQDANEKWDWNGHHYNYQNSAAFQAWQVLYGPLAPTDIAWHSMERNEQKNYAVFGEVNYNLTDKITLTFGGRWYDTSARRDYQVYQPASRFSFDANHPESESGFLKKFGIQYHVAENKMIYFTYAEGFRPGGVNRSRGNPILPLQFKPDYLDNYEAGIRTQWLDNRLRVNLTGFHDVWQDMQLQVVDPSFYLGGQFQSVVTNVGSAAVDGFGFDMSAVPFKGADIGVNGTYLINNETTSALSVSAPGLPPGRSLSLPKGTRLPLAARFKLSAYLQYSWPVGFINGDAYVRFQYSYTGSSINQLEQQDPPFQILNQPAYQIGDLKVGFNRDSWHLQMYLDNMWDERAQTFLDHFTDIGFWGGRDAEGIRPRNFGLRITKDF